MIHDFADNPLESVIFPGGKIAARVRELGVEITRDCAARGVRELTVVAVADGALMFAADLLRELPMRVRFASVRVSAYGDGMRPKAKADILGPLPDLAGAHALIVEDILDTGLTLGALTETLSGMRPASLRTVVLLDKPSGRRRPFAADHVGFQCPDAFVVGYGLDLAGRYRNLPDIGVLRSELRPA